jgi:hypothetical protein
MIHPRPCIQRLELLNKRLTLHTAGHTNLRAPETQGVETPNLKRYSMEFINPFTIVRKSSG